MLPESDETKATRRDNVLRDKLARRAGAVYLTYIAFGAASMFLQNRLVVWVSLPLTFQHLQQRTQQFRLCFFLAIVAAMFFLLATWSYFLLLKKVQENLALLLVLMNPGGIAAECASAIVRFGALECVVGNDLLHAFAPDQLQALSMLLLRVSLESIRTVLLSSLNASPLYPPRPCASSMLLRQVTAGARTRSLSKKVLRLTMFTSSVPGASNWSRPLVRAVSSCSASLAKGISSVLPRCSKALRIVLPLRLSNPAAFIRFPAPTFFNSCQPIPKQSNTLFRPLPENMS
jgi:hypothetical protein